ncbi:HNH endonuclease signature motif containing protein [Roseomonas haemaphysalidis]|uniref:HNH endonuclease n=1 Tax=Roseomonas haemaphysalidis TaxID=2768162 RepID=A0ABS3KTS3_9PROT|nr:HNH endonuclease signature motif containing protein [Roseomonas haemaphysalidis]MBO1080875.1 HNH endonuclease [Roseomonas haemaphysalidis]
MSKTDILSDPAQMVELRRHMPRFLDRTMPEPNSGCWLWMGRADYSNPRYTAATFEIRLVRFVAPRVSVAMHRGPIPVGLCVLHKCDNPLCVNPDHLFVGTRAENTADMFAKGRSRTAPVLGERHGQAKLNPAAVKHIRASALPGNALAKQLGVSPTAVWSVRTGRTWSHVS